MDLDSEELEATKKKKCEYCKEDMQGKPIEDRFSVDTLVDDVFLYAWCDCGKHTVAEINYCPMCGRKLQ